MKAAARNPGNSKEVMTLLLGGTPLWIAAKGGHDTVVNDLVQRRDVNVNSMSISGRSPLFWPSWCNMERIVTILIDAGADPHLVDENRDTPVTVATRNGHGRVVRVLERSG